MPRRTKQYEDEPETPALNIGSFSFFVEIPKDDKPKKKNPIGFVRPKKKKCRSKNTAAPSAKK